MQTVKLRLFFQLSVLQEIVGLSICLRYKEFPEFISAKQRHRVQETSIYQKSITRYPLGSSKSLIHAWYTSSLLAESNHPHHHALL